MSRRYVWLALFVLGCGASHRARQPSGSSGSTSGTSGGSTGTTGAFPGTRFPRVPANSGEVLSPLTLVTIVAAGDPSSSQIFAFSDQLGASSWWAAVAPQYGLTTITNVDVTGPAITSSMGDSAFAQYLQQAMGQGVPPPNGKTVYLLYLPDGVQLIDQGFIVCGYHTTYPPAASTSATADNFAVVSRDCGTPPDGETLLNTITMTASHEIFESATDPQDNSFSLGAPTTHPWEASVWDGLEFGDIELADLCVGTRTFVPDADGGWAYQRIWSDAAVQDESGDPCAPPLGLPYYSVTSDQDWYTVQPGMTVQLSFKGWATGAAPDWLVSSYYQNGSEAMQPIAAGGIHTTTDLGVVTGSTCMPRQGMNQGRAGVVNVIIPADAGSGDWAVISMHSFRQDPSTCLTPLTEDEFHSALVGIYVP